MGKYIYELHCHTAQTSACSGIDARDLVKFYHDRGYAGVCITDHFFNGNTTVPRKGDWRERVEKFCSGFYAACDEGIKLGMDVFFGWEYSYHGTDFLTYGLSPEWLMENEHCLGLSIREYCALVRSLGGYIFHAHPFREAGYIEMIRLIPRDVDGVEVFNAQRTELENHMADIYADNYHLLKIGGSDFHGSQPKLAGMEFCEKQASILDICTSVSEGKGKIVSM